MVSEVSARVRAAFDGRFELTCELGRGTIASVFAAHDLVTDRPIALKVLFPELTSTVGADRFRREIRIGARLSHPHIVPIYGSGESHGLFYFTMPLLEGETLASRLDRERQLPLEDALEITRQVAGALGHAHDCGIIHRDIKPQNIMLTPGGAVTMDFGVAALVQSIGVDRLTESGLAMGTPAYMSPEQATGEPTIDGRSDVYSLACVLYELLTGAPPFGGSSSRTILLRHARDPVPPVSTARPGIPGAIESVLTRALAKRPAKRFPSASRFAEALDRAHGRRRPPRVAGTVSHSASRALRVAAFVVAAIGLAWAAFQVFGRASSEPIPVRAIAVPTDSGGTPRVYPLRADN